MKYVTLYRKYRPQIFKEVIGQEQIITTLINTIKNNKIAHAYLFCGPRGTGKTSTAKILAKTINCLQIENGDACNKCINCQNYQENKIMDLIEIDGASNNGVDEIRELRERVNLLPGQVKYKIYIIDEVHMLTNNAFNALLKTLEEPPNHVIFILATTEPHKIPITVISRCQKYDFKRVTKKNIINNLEMILKKENINYDLQSLSQIAILAEGGVRDSLSILEQVIAYSEDNITLEKINNLFLIPSITEKITFLQFLIHGNMKMIITMIEQYFNNGIDITRLTHDLINILKDILIFQITNDEDLLIILSKDNVSQLKINSDEIMKMIDIYLEALNNYKFTNNLKMYFELYNLKIINLFKTNNDNVAINIVTDKNNKKLQNSIIDENIIVADQITLVNNNIKKDTVQPKIENKVNEVDEIIKVGLDEELEKVANLTVDKEETSLTAIEEWNFELNVIRPIVWTINDYINVIIQADKDIRNHRVLLWNDLEKYLTNNKYKVFAKLLLDTSIVATTENSFILGCETEHQADIINTYSCEDLFQEFLSQVLKVKDILILAISRDNLINVKKEYFQLRAVNKLQKPFSFDFSKYKPKSSLLNKIKDKTDQSLQQAQELFGNINIVD